MYICQISCGVVIVNKIEHRVNVADNHNMATQPSPVDRYLRCTIDANFNHGSIIQSAAQCNLVDAISMYFCRIA